MMSVTHDWQPTATIDYLKKRAEIIAKIRQFFFERGVWEVETPALSLGTITDPYIQAIQAKAHIAGALKTLYLQTSPEYSMKRLLAAGSGSIYQMAKAFRDDEAGRFHNIEFTLLEWYRLDFNHHQLMDEVDALLQLILGCHPAKRYTYREIFEEKIGINPHAISLEYLRDIAYEKGLEDVKGINSSDKDLWLQRLMSDVIEPELVGESPFMIYDFPISQASLAQIQKTIEPVASRFEVYCQGIELANGFHELLEVNEQAKRFTEDNHKRAAQGLSVIEIDQRLLAALEAGLPPCAGVALGVDRLVMLALGADDIQSVISFAGLSA
jgi:elongation factor P--(R)-beta-lysine ligase